MPHLSAMTIVLWDFPLWIDSQSVLLEDLLSNLLNVTTHLYHSQNFRSTQSCKFWLSKLSLRNSYFLCWHPKKFILDQLAGKWYLPEGKQCLNWILRHYLPVSFGRYLLEDPVLVWVGWNQDIYWPT